LELLEGRALSKLLLERYSRNPRNWSFTVSPSTRSDGFFDAVFANQEEVWQLKLDSIFKPSPLILGARADVDPLKIASPSPISYGYRRLEPLVLLELLKGLAKSEELAGEGSEPSREALSNVDSILSSLETVAPRPGESYAEGPYVFTTRNATIISEGQKKLEERMSFELKKIMKNRFPSYG
jgi:hypothetical protein